MLNTPDTPPPADHEAQQTVPPQVDPAVIAQISDHQFVDAQRSADQGDIETR